MGNPLTPSPALLCKIGSIAAHLEEGSSIHGHEFDITAAKALLSDPEVIAWMKEMRAMAMLPEPRNKPKKATP